MKSKLPDTSISAYKEAEKMITPHHKKIIGALKVLGVAIYETIAAKTGLEKHAVGRRLSELESQQIVCKLGGKQKTKTGRMAYEYSLTESGKDVDVGKYEAPPMKNKKQTTTSHNPLFD